ncbi:integral membrane protein DUF92-domain-containing protein [Xylariaceae sp. FL0594]|nr:integral membrane protein DUF92-domain-containing protein [Xylariaceae sp. FL0594]
MRAIIAVPATLGLVYRAYSRNSLTPFGIFVAGLTATIHALHPWSLPFVLLVVFFLAGTRATAVKKEVKASLTLHAQGSSGGEGPRTHVQVLANSLVASVLSLLHTYQLRLRRDAVSSGQQVDGSFCYGWGGDLLVVGIIANYAAVCADTFSSELGILSRTEPRLITSPTLRKVPRGTNGGVTVWGLVAGFLGSMIIVTTSLILLPMCGDHTSGKPGGGEPWSMQQKLIFACGMTIWGTCGSLLDSFLGGWLQRSVRDVRTGKIVEGEGGVRVLTSSDAQSTSVVETTVGAKAKLMNGEGAKAVEDTSAVDDTATSGDQHGVRNKNRKSSFGDGKPTRVAETGWDLLDNNDVNFLMAFTMSLGGMAVASWYWGIPLASILQP